MKTFTNLDQLIAFNTTLAGIITAQIMEDDLKETFMYSLGGDVHVGTTKEDYKELMAMIPQFDYITSLNGEWEVAGIINNNSGGPTYFFPSDIEKRVTE
jgi:hypothetical protein